MKISLFAILALGLSAATAVPAYASGHHVAKPLRAALNCGWPHPDPGCSMPANPVSPTPPPAPATPVADPTDTGGIIGALVAVKADFLADLNAVATMAATPNTATSASWDPTALWCLNGTPAQGTSGQPGYIPAYGGLIDWVNSITLPASTTVSVPSIPAGGGVAADAEEVWLQALAAYEDVNPIVNSIVSNLNNFGPPQSVMAPCGALIQNRIQTVQNAALTAGAQLAMFNAILLKYLPQAAVLGHVKMAHPAAK